MSIDMVDVKTEAQYQEVRNKYIVREIYGRNDSLSLGEKKVRLERELSGGQEASFSYHSTDFDGKGGIKDGSPLNLQTIVACLELSVLMEKGFLCVELC